MISDAVPVHLILHLDLLPELFDRLLDALDSFRMNPTRSGYDAFVRAQRPASGEIERCAVHVADDSTGFGDEERARSVVLWGVRDVMRGDGVENVKYETTCRSRM